MTHIGSHVDLVVVEPLEDPVPPRQDAQRTEIGREEPGTDGLAGEPAPAT